MNGQAYKKCAARKILSQWPLPEYPQDPRVNNTVKNQMLTIKVKYNLHITNLQEGLCC